MEKNITKSKQNEFTQPMLPSNNVNKTTNSKSLVPPVLKEVGRLAVGVASVTSIQQGSATGNPRNKCALQPGHSLMDWIRLGNSGKNLTGLGSKAGHVSVNLRELAKHNTKQDAWLAIRGKVYNVTSYLPFHPGGEEELMKGAGIDATALFDEVHPWVNYEQILNKCLVGKLRTAQIDLSGNSDTPIPLPISTVQSQSKSPPPTTPQPPKFDWIQKTDHITLIVYTKSFSNPFVEACPPLEGVNFTLRFAYDGNIFSNTFTLHKAVLWPCNLKVTVETGKIEIVFRKSEPGIWETYGSFKQTAVSSEFDWKIVCACVVKKKIAVCHDTVLLKLERKDTSKVVVPIGKHVNVWCCDDVRRKYTPVPECLFTEFTPNAQPSGDVCLMVKKYPAGRVSRYVTGLEENDDVNIGRPIGDFRLEELERREGYLLLAAGTGITPMLALLLFLLERKIKKCQFVRLLFFNKTQNDIPFKDQFDFLEQKDSRFRITHILSQPNETWKGLTGHIRQEIVSNSLEEHFRGTGYTKSDIYSCICGPTVFNQLAVEVLTSLGISAAQCHVFDG